MTRIQRIARLIKEEVSSILRTRVSDPRIGFVSITDVEVSPDIKYAKIFVSILGDEDTKKETMKGLMSATKFIRGELGGRIDFRVVPEVSFKRDDSIERGVRVLALMAKLKKEKAQKESKKGPGRKRK